MSKIIPILFLVLAFGEGAFGNSSYKERSFLYGVDNIQMPNDSLVLMNSLLVDYHVDYEIAFAIKNPNEICIALHKIGLVYLKLEQFDLATNYGWRLLNVAQKYKLDEYELFAYAMLYRVYKDSGKIKQSSNMYKDYQTKLSSIQEESIKQKIANPSNVLMTTVFKEEVIEGVAPSKKNRHPVNLSELKKEAKIFDVSYWLIILGSALILSWVLLKMKRRFSQQPVLLVNNPESAILDIEPTKIKKEFTDVKTPSKRLELPIEDQESQFLNSQKEKVVLDHVNKECIPKPTEFEILMEHISNLLSQKGTGFNLSVVGQFHHFSKSSYSGFLYIFESLAKNNPLPVNGKLDMEWIEVPKGIVINIRLEAFESVFNRDSFEEWGKKVFEKYHIIVKWMPNSVNHSTLIVKKYY